MIIGSSVEKLIKIAIAISIVIVNSVAYGALNDLGDGQIEDTAQNLVWLKDGNAFKTLCDANDPIATGFTPVSGDELALICFTGRMTWEDAEAWVARLNSQSYLGFTDWRQPAVSQPDSTCSLQFSAPGFIDQGYGLDCMGSEISRLYIDELALNPSACPSGSPCFQGSAPFVNVGIFYYWTGTPVLSFPDSSFSLSTSANTGEQLLHVNSSRSFVWPVRALLPQVRASLGGHALEEGAQDGRVAIVRTGSTAAPLTVNLSVSDNGATSGLDYVAIVSPTTITIPARSDTADFFITPIDDVVVEAGIERVTVTITESVDYTINSASGSVGIRILDNDEAPVDSDAFPGDPVEDVDTDGDGIGDNGDAGGTAIGVRVVDAIATCAFQGAVISEPVTASNAPGTPFSRQLRFVLTSCGSPVTVQAVFGEVLPPGAVAYKVSLAGEWTIIPGATISGNTVTYTIEDNGPLDADDVVGQITDPVTVVTPGISGAQAIPILPAWAIALLSIFSCMLGVSFLRNPRFLTEVKGRG